MRKILLAAAGFAVIAGVSGLALAHDHGRPGPHGVFESDANSDGVLTRAEFDAGRASLFARLDADSNGQLSREEMRAHRGERGHRRYVGGHALERADANNDGAITREEFMAHPTEMFDRIDANHDGVISADERPQRPERGERRADGPSRPDRPNPDANGDHLISQAEFAAMGARMFERLDANDDGRVTQDEARAARPPRHGRD